MVDSLLWKVSAVYRRHVSQSTVDTFHNMIYCQPGSGRRLTVNTFNGEMKTKLLFSNLQASAQGLRILIMEVV